MKSSKRNSREGWESRDRLLPTERRLRVFLQVVLCMCVGIAPLAAQDVISLAGSGSNVPSPLYTAWTQQYGKMKQSVQVNYLQLGTSESIKEISQGVGDFGGGEIPLTDSQMHKGKHPLLEFPTVLVAIVPIYKLPGEHELRFSGELLADIFMGNIKNWKDARIAKLNPAAELPDLPIVVVHRSSGKGSNYILSDFLSKTGVEWKSKIGKSPSPNWPVGVETNRSEDMVAKVSGTPGAIGYVELNYAKRKDTWIRQRAECVWAVHSGDAGKHCGRVHREREERSSGFRRVADECRRERFVPVSKLHSNLRSGLGYGARAKPGSEGILELGAYGRARDCERPGIHRFANRSCGKSA